jgi:hypothetical protein
MRVTRLLAHWSICGFRQLSIGLVLFLEKEIYSDFGYAKYLILYN